MRIATLFTDNLEKLDPANISTGVEYEILTNLYGRLIKFDDGKFNVDIPERFEISRNQVIFEFGERSVTNTGHVINAIDAAVSLKRLIYRKKSAHWDIRRFLCPNFDLDKLDDPCPGIETVGNQLILTLTKEEFVPHLLASLESADFGIIPARIIDRENGLLIDKRHRETSGRYFVSAEDEESFTILANKKHYDFSAQTISEIRLVKRKSYDSFAAFERGEIDIIPASVYFSGAHASRVLLDSRNHVHSTFPIRVLMLQFSRKAISDFSVQQRLRIANLVGSKLKQKIGQAGATDTLQFFQLLSDATLNEGSIARIKEIHAAAGKEKSKLPRTLMIGVYPPHVEKLKESLASIPGIDTMVITVPGSTLPESEQPDLFYVTTDSAWRENLSVISYNFNTGAFFLPGMDQESWLQDYLSTTDQSERIKRLTRLHEEILAHGTIVPQQSAPYHAVSNAGYILNQSKMMTVTEWHKIRRN